MGTQIVKSGFWKGCLRLPGLGYFKHMFVPPSMLEDGEATRGWLKRELDKLQPVANAFMRKTEGKDMDRKDAAKVAVLEAGKISEDLRLQTLAEAVRNMDYGPDFPFGFSKFVESLGGKRADIGPLLMDRAARRGLVRPSHKI